MTALDRQVAERRGWHIEMLPDEVVGPEEYWVKDGKAQWPVYSYHPHRVLKQAYQLWEEARLEGWRLAVYQTITDKWAVRPLNKYGLMAPTEIAVDFADLPRAITTAWLEAMEGN